MGIDRELRDELQRRLSLQPAWVVGAVTVVLETDVFQREEDRLYDLGQELAREDRYVAVLVQREWFNLIERALVESGSDMAFCIRHGAHLRVMAKAFEEWYRPMSVTGPYETGKAKPTPIPSRMKEGLHDQLRGLG